MTIAADIRADARDRLREAVLDPARTSRRSTRRRCETLDSTVRLVVSHAEVPVDPPDVVGRRLARLAERTLEVA